MWSWRRSKVRKEFEELRVAHHLTESPPSETRPVARRNEVCGQIKLSLQYHRGALTVMVSVGGWRDKSMD